MHAGRPSVGRSSTARLPGQRWTVRRQREAGQLDSNHPGRAVDRGQRYRRVHPGLRAAATVVASGLIPIRPDVIFPALPSRHDTSPRGAGPRTDMRATPGPVSSASHGSPKSFTYLRAPDRIPGRQWKKESLQGGAGGGHPQFAAAPRTTGIVPRLVVESTLRRDGSPDPRAFRIRV